MATDGTHLRFAMFRRMIVTVHNIGHSKIVIKNFAYRLMVIIIATLSDVAFADEIIQQVSANGTRNLRPFTVVDNWEIQWDSKAGIHIGIHRPDGELVAEGGSSTKPGHGTSYHPRGGTYYLEVMSMDDWTVTVTQLPPTPPSKTDAASTSPSSAFTKSSDSDIFPLSDFQWSRSRFGALFVSFAVNNSTNQALRDFTIACSTYGASGTHIGTISKTLFETLPAKSTVEYEGVEIGPMHPQARTVRCSIVRLYKEAR